MADNFTQTVNLREKMEKERAAMLSRANGAERPAPAPAPKAKPARKPERTATSRPSEKKKPRTPNHEESGPVSGNAAPDKSAARDRAEGIDEIYKENSGYDSRDDLRKINRPIVRRVNESLYRRIAIVLAVILAMISVYWLVFHRAGAGSPASETPSEPKWYMVELTSGETYYGQISDKSANPVVLTTVYYNYDQLNPGEAKPSDNSGNLKLVKRGQETAGPSGTMYIYQVQIKTIDELGPDSKVLKAILDNENK